MDATRHTHKRDIPMEMSRRRDRNRVNFVVQQFVNIGYRGTAQRTGNELSLLPIGIRDAEQFSAGQTGEYRSKIAAHDAHAYDTHTQRTPRACYCSLPHVSTVPQAPLLSPSSPSTARYFWRLPAQNGNEHVLIQSVTTVHNGNVESVSSAYSAAREAGTASRKPAATASSRKDFTAARESSAAVLVPSAGSFFRTSAGAVMMWQPIVSASTTLKTSRVEAQMISMLRVLRAQVTASCMIGR